MRTTWNDRNIFTNIYLTSTLILVCSMSHLLTWRRNLRPNYRQPPGGDTDNLSSLKKSHHVVHLYLQTLLSPHRYRWTVNRFTCRLPGCVSSHIVRVHRTERSLQNTESRCPQTPPPHQAWTHLDTKRDTLVSDRLLQTHSRYTMTG